MPIRRASSLCAVLAGAAALLAAGPSSAQPRGPADQCSSESVRPQSRILACSDLITRQAQALSNENLSAAYNNRGISFAALGQADRAMEDYNESIRVDPRNAAAWNNRGNALLNTNQPERAIADLDEAIRLQPRYAAAYNNRGNARVALNRREEAMQDFDEAIRINDQYPAALFNRGLLLTALGQHQRAVADFDAALAIVPRTLAVVVARANAYAALGRRDKAIEDYELATQLDSRNVYALNALCWNRAVLGSHALALRECDAALRLQPDDPDILDSRAYAYFRAGRLDDAMRDYQTVLDRNPRAAMSLWGRGVLRARRGDRSGAEADFASARAINAGIDAEATAIGLVP